MMMEKRHTSTRKSIRQAEKLKVLSLAQYLDTLPEKPLFPEHSRAVWKRFFQYKNEFPDLQEILDTPVSLAMERYAFYLNPQDNQRDGCNWALSTFIIDMPLPVHFAEFVQDRPFLQEILSHENPVLTDSFMFADGYPGEQALMEQGLIMLNSPVAQIHENFSDYLTSLNSDRRKKFRRMEEEFAPHDLKFEMSQRILHPAEFSFVVENLKKKWGEDFLYALCQTLWALAVAEYYPERVYVMRVSSQDRLVFLQIMIARGDVMYCQSIVKDEDVHYNGIAAYTDFQCIKAFCGQAYKFFDPSCRTGLNDPESIGVAKRATINTNRVKPIFAAGQDLAASVQEILAGQQIQGKPL